MTLNKNMENVKSDLELTFNDKRIQMHEINSIQLDDIIKIYKRGKIEVVALRGLTCKFSKGEISVIMGPSGCGKTTLLNLIAGMDRPSAGKILINNENILDLSDRDLEKYRRYKIGYVFQFLNLIPVLSAYENIELPMLLVNKSRSGLKERVTELLKLVKLEDRLHHKPDELSGGEQQRVAIAMALANNADIILCDEPTGELDTESKHMVMNAIENILKNYPNKIIIIVSHDKEWIRIADRLYYITDGNISRELNKEEIKEEIGQILDVSGKGSLRELREKRKLLDSQIKEIERNNE